MFTDSDYLDQFDYCDNDEIHAIVKSHAYLIGQYLILFSFIEHTLNVGIAEAFNERAHDPGYLLLASVKVEMAEKIDLFIKFRKFHINGGKKGKTKLRLLKKLEELKPLLSESNTFRNSIAHANWATLDKKYSVRSGIKTDLDSYSVKFKKSDVSPKIFSKNFKKIDRVLKIFEELEEC